MTRAYPPSPTFEDLKLESFESVNCAVALRVAATRGKRPQSHWLKMLSVSGWPLLQSPIAITSNPPVAIAQSVTSPLG